MNQLLQQNAMLHQELTEARLSSGSCSNVSLDGRSEGCGSRRSGSGLQRRGKGIGSDLVPAPSQQPNPRVFTPPWTSFALAQDPQFQSIFPKSASHPGFVQAVAPSAGPAISGQWAWYESVPNSKFRF